MRKTILSVFICASILLLGAVVSCSDSNGTEQTGDSSVPTTDGSASSADAGLDASGQPTGDASATGFCEVTGYAPCGGEIIGNWEIIEWCPGDQAAAQTHCEHPYGDRQECQSAPNGSICEFQRSGKLTLFEEGKIILDRNPLIMNMTYFFDPGCLAVASRIADPEQACLDMSTAGKLSCSFAGDLCTCKGTVNEEDINDLPVEPIEGQFEQVDTTKIKATVQGEIWFEATYCIQDDRLTMDVFPHEDTWQYWVHRRIAP